VYLHTQCFVLDSGAVGFMGTLTTTSRIEDDMEGTELVFLQGVTDANGQQPDLYVNPDDLSSRLPGVKLEVSVKTNGSSMRASHPKLAQEQLMTQVADALYEVVCGSHNLPNCIKLTPVLI